MIYTSEILLPVIAQAESYFARLLNDNVDRLEKGKKPIHLDTIEKLWLYKEALGYANDLELYDSELTTKIYEEVVNLIAGHQVTITISNGEISNPALDYYLIGDAVSTPLATSLIFGKVRLSTPALVATLPVVVGDNDPRLIDYDTAFNRSITGATFDSTGNLVLTKEDLSIITSTNSVILNQSDEAQVGSFWISGGAIVEGFLTLANLTDPGTKDYVIVADSSGNLYKRTKAEFSSDLSFGGYTAGRVMVSNSSGVIEASSITSAELANLSGVTSNIQSQIDSKQPLDADLTSIAAVTDNGFLVKNGIGTYSTRLLSAGSGINVSHGYGTSGTTTITNTQTQYTNAMTRGAISSSTTGLSYNSTTGVFSLTSGYAIPTSSQITNWTTAYNSVISSAAFGTSDGVLTLTKRDSSTVTVDLDGRYLLGNQTITLSGDVTGTGTTAIDTTIATNAVTFAKIQNITTNTLLGRTTSGDGNIESITIGSGLRFTSMVLSLAPLTVNKLVVTDSSGIITASAVTSTEAGYLAGVTSSVQTQLDAKQNLDATLTALAAIGSGTIGVVVLNGVDSFTTRVLEGSTNRITVNNGNGSSTNPSIDIASTYVGQSTITTLGAITSGSWTSTPIADAYVSSSSNWNTAYNSKINSLSFNTSTGYLTATKQDSSTIAASLDGRYLALDGGTMTDYIVLSADPTIALHPATKQYVDNIATGIKPKGSVSAATTTSLPSYSGATLTLTGTSNGALAAQDGVTLTLGQYLLVKNESGANEKYNGIYEVTEVGDGSNPFELTRASNTNTWAELVNGSVFVAGGTILQGYTYYCTAVSGGTLGTTAITFVVLSSSTVYNAGLGIDIIGSTISIESGSIVDSLISSSAAIALSKLATVTANRLLLSDGTGLITASTITNTEVGYLSGITSSVQTQLNGKQPLDATLTALSGLDTSGGLVVQTGADTFIKRTISGVINRTTVTNGDGISSNPTVDISASYIGQNTITTLGTIISGVWNGTAITDSYISSATNWNTAYTNRITTLTTTGSSGSATLVTNTLNIPTYTLTGLGGVPSLRELTIAGTTNQVTVNATSSQMYDLSSNRTWTIALPQSIATTSEVEFADLKLNSLLPLEDEFYILGISLGDHVGTVDNAYFISTLDLLTVTVADATYYLATNPDGYTTNTGTVTSVSMSTPTGLSISGSPITTSGTLALTLTAGYSIPTTSSQTNWDTAYTNRITSLTVTGSSGAATLVSNTLNIPTYTLAGLGGQPLATNLTSLSGLSYVSTSFVKMTAAGTFALDTNTYLTGNQTITLSGDVSGTGTTAITTTIGALKVTNAMLAGSIAASKLVGTDITTVGTITSGVWNAGAVTSSAGISGTTGAFSSNVTVTGNLTVDTNTFFVDSVNNRIGIGTTSPLSGMMHLYGTAGASAVRWSEAAVTVGFVGGANGLVTGKNGSFMIRGESGLVLSGVGNGNNLFIDSTGDIQTNSATDTGEHFIIGGSARVNGNLLVSSNVDINGTTLNLGNNTIVDSYTGNSSTYRVLVLTDGTANTNIGLNYNPVANAGGGFNGTGQIFIAHNKGILASNAAGNNYIGVLRPIGTGVYFGGSLSSGELAGDGLFIATSGAATFSSSVTAVNLGLLGASPASDTAINLNGTTAAQRLAHIGTTGADSYIQSAASTGVQLVVGSDAYSLMFRNDIGFNFGLGTASALKINSSGATFSSSVTAASLIKTGSSDSFFLLGGGGTVAISSYVLSSSISGTSGTVALFGASNSLGDSIITQSGTSISVGGRLLTDYAGYGLAANNSSGNRLVKIGTASNGEAAIQATLSAGTVYDLHINPEGGQIITANATDTGEHFIVGGTFRANGFMNVSKVSGGNTAIWTNTTDADLQINLTSGVTLLSPTTGILAFGTSSTERMRIDASGNVGIGTTSPTAKLHLLTTTGAYGTALAKFEDNWSVAALKFMNPAGASFGLQAYAQDNPTSYTNLILNHQGGNVLIGTSTTSSSDKMQIHSESTTSLRFTSTDNTLFRGVVFGSVANDVTEYAYLKYLPQTGELRMFGSPTGFGGFVSFYNNNIEEGRISVGGRWLIGTTTDNSVDKLQVNGSARVNGQVTTTSTSGYRLLSGSDTLFSLGYSGGTLLDRLTSTAFYLAENGSPQLTIATGGAATFSSSVTATSFINSTSSNSYFLLGGGGTTAISNYLTTATAASTYQPLDSTLTALAAFNSNGIMVQTAADTFIARTITAGTGISVTNGNGVSTNPTIAIDTTYAIQNQAASAQTANFWISGDAKVNGKVYIGTNGAYFEEVFVGGLYKIQVTDSAGNVTVL